MNPTPESLAMDSNSAQQFTLPYHCSTKVPSSTSALQSSLAAQQSAPGPSNIDTPSATNAHSSEIHPLIDAYQAHSLKTSSLSQNELFEELCRIIKACKKTQQEHNWSVKKDIASIKRLRANDQGQGQNELEQVLRESRRTCVARGDLVIARGVKKRRNWSLPKAWVGRWPKPILILELLKKLGTGVWRSASANFSSSPHLPIGSFQRPSALRHATKGWLIPYGLAACPDDVMIETFCSWPPVRCFCGFYGGGVVISE